MEKTPNHTTCNLDNRSMNLNLEWTTLGKVRLLGKIDFYLGKHLITLFLYRKEEKMKKAQHKNILRWFSSKTCTIHQDQAILKLSKMNKSRKELIMFRFVVSTIWYNCFRIHLLISSIGNLSKITKKMSKSKKTRKDRTWNIFYWVG